jgi:pyruvate/2-oxoglutarate dehydrogenase complex dihydrolipoamide acyltransferase (E2) component
MSVPVKVPEIGESVSEVEIGDWQRSEGDTVETDETLVVIDSDKASIELPAPTSGSLVRILKKAGERAGVGDVIAEIEETSAEGRKDDRQRGQHEKEAEVTRGAEEFQLDVVLRRLHSLLEPAPHAHVVDVHELGADRAAVRAAEPLENLAEGPNVGAAHRARGEALIEIGGRELVELERELRHLDVAQAEGVGPRGEVATDPVGAHELVDPVLPDRRVGLRRGAARAVAGCGRHRPTERGPAARARHEGVVPRQLLEVRPQAARHRAGVADVVLVEGLQEGEAQLRRRARVRAAAQEAPSRWSGMIPPARTISTWRWLRSWRRRYSSSRVTFRATKGRPLARASRTSGSSSSSPCCTRS